MTDDEEYNEWLATRPPVIQDLAKNYPFGTYKIKPGAPYSISCPGTIVELIGYRVTGEVHIAVLAKHFMPAAIEHIRALCEQYQKDFEHMSKQDHRVIIDPCWLWWYPPIPDALNIAPHDAKNEN